MTETTKKAELHDQLEKTAQELAKLSDEEFFERQRQRLIGEHGLTPQEADRILEEQERLANLLFDRWLKKNNTKIA